MTLSTKELKELEELQQELNRAIEKEIAIIIERLVPYVKEINKLRSKANAQRDQAQEEKQNTPFTNPYYESTYKNKVKIEPTLVQIEKLAKQARPISRLFHQYEAQQKKLNALFEEARRTDSLETLKKKLPVESRSFKSGRMQAIVSKIIDFGTSPKPSSFFSSFKNAWNRLFRPQKNLPVAEARVEQVLTPRPVNANSFIEPSSILIATPLPSQDPPVSGEQLVRKLSSQIHSSEDNAQNDHFLATIEQTLAHSKTNHVAEKRQQNTETSEQEPIPHHPSAE